MKERKDLNISILLMRGMGTLIYYFITTVKIRDAMLLTLLVTSRSICLDQSRSGGTPRERVVTTLVERSEE